MLRAITLTAAAVVALVGISASAQENAPSDKSRGRACFLVNDVRNWEDARGGRFIIRTGRGEFYEAKFFGPCPQVDFTQTIVLEPSVGSRRICEGDEAHILIPGRLTCRADQFRKMSADEVAALPKLDRP